MKITINVGDGLDVNDANCAMEWLFDGGFYKSDVETIHKEHRSGIDIIYHTTVEGDISIDIMRLELV